MLVKVGVAVVYNPKPQPQPQGAGCCHRVGEPISTSLTW